MQMTEKAVNGRAIIVANGVMASNTDLISLLRADDLVIAADGGGRYCLQIGCIPNILIGDFDSLSALEVDEIEETGTEVHRHPICKAETDLELAIEMAIQKEVREIVILGALGGRWDQTLANLMLLGHQRFSETRIRILDGNHEITLLLPHAAHIICGSPGDTVSLIPVSGNAHGVTTSGLEYPMQTGELPFGATLGISNTLTATEATVSFQSGLLICIVIRNPGRMET